MKLTKQQTALHHEALALVHLPRELTEDEVQMVLENFHPGANHNITNSGAFFTPPEMARDFAVFAYPTGDPGGLRYIDACAGIGTLSWALLQVDKVEKKIKEIVAVESNAEYVEIGRKILPQVQWVHGSIFDLELLKKLGFFDIGVSNPPFGNLKVALDERNWLPFQQPAHMAVAAVLTHLCERGAEMIIPDADHSLENKHNWTYDKKGRRISKPVESSMWSANYRRFQTAYPGMILSPDPIDNSIYTFKEATPSVAVVSLEHQKGKNPYFKHYCAAHGRS